MIPIVAIDGPAASGKSSTAAAVASRLGYLHVDSGALYRGLTRVALDAAALDAPTVLLPAAEARGLALRATGNRVEVLLDGGPAEDRIRDPEVTAAVSQVAAIPEVRDWVNERLRGLVSLDRPLVVDGRDIGTAVFPEAAVKIFLTATPLARARRRLLQQGQVPEADLLAAEAQRIAARDRLDAERPVAPLQPAGDAVLLDTTALSFDAQVEQIVRLIRDRGLPSGGLPP